MIFVSQRSAEALVVPERLVIAGTKWLDDGATIPLPRALGKRSPAVLTTRSCASSKPLRDLSEH